MIQTTGLFAMLAPRKDEILAGAVAQSRLIGAQPTVDIVKDSAVNFAKNVLLGILEPQCKATLDGAVVMYQITAGPRPVDIDYNDETYVGWRDVFDTSIMDAIGADALRMSGQDFIGGYITDSEIDEEAVRDSAAKAMAANILQSAIGDRTPGQVCAEMNIVAEDIAKVATASPQGAQASAAAEAPTIAEPVARAHVERLVGTWAIRHGIANFDMDATTELLKGAFDDDPFLPLSYIERFDGKTTDAPYFASYFRAAGKDAVAATASAAMLAALTGQIVEMPAGTPKGRKKKGAAGDEGASTVAPPPPPSVPATASPAAAPQTGTAGAKEDIADVIKLMREHGADSDQAIGDLVGKSRATIKNISDGKTTLKADPELRAKLKRHVQQRVAGLQQAVARLG